MNIKNKISFVFLVQTLCSVPIQNYILNNKDATSGMAMPCFLRLVSFVLKIMPECSSDSELFGEGIVRQYLYKYVSEERYAFVLT